MVNALFQPDDAALPAAAVDVDPHTYLKQAIAQGRHWYEAMLAAMSHWRIPEETVNGRYYRYVIGGEAFDWLLLAERLCDTLDGVVPSTEKEALLFAGRPPIDLDEAEMCSLMGESLYRAHLNFFYGVTVEEALHLAVEEEVLKEQRASVWRAGNCHRADEEAFSRIYGQPRAQLLHEFAVTYGLVDSTNLSLTEMKEFLYWLFRYRVRRCDPARVASDTRKALLMLDRLSSRRLLRQNSQAQRKGRRARRLVDLQ